MVITKATEWLAEKREPAVPSAQPEPDSGNGGVSRHSIPQRDAAGESRLLDTPPLDEVQLAYAEPLKCEIAKVEENITRTEANINNSPRRHIGYLKTLDRTFRDTYRAQGSGPAETRQAIIRLQPRYTIMPLQLLLFINNKQA
ncbi:hypothetical protein FCOIX_13235 [Fusarium coicis]|nr:hypothetical protein FCOIX_13235 [Fusarium coicis]